MLLSPVLLLFFGGVLTQHREILAGFHIHPWTRVSFSDLPFFWVEKAILLCKQKEDFHLKRPDVFFGDVKLQDWKTQGHQTWNPILPYTYSNGLY